MVSMALKNGKSQRCLQERSSDIVTKGHRPSKSKKDQKSFVV